MSHQEPHPDELCQICCCPIDEETYCEYKTHSTHPTWSPSSLCLDCVNYLISSQWDKHLEMVSKIDCRRAAIEVCRSVPLYVHERSTFLCPTHSEDCPLKGQIELLWAKFDDSVIIPILEGAKQGEEREQYIKHLESIAELYEADKEADIQAVQQGIDLQQQQQQQEFQSQEHQSQSQQQSQQSQSQQSP